MPSFNHGSLTKISRASKPAPHICVVIEMLHLLESVVFQKEVLHLFLWCHSSTHLINLIVHLLDLLLTQLYQLVLVVLFYEFCNFLPAEVALVADIKFLEHLLQILLYLLSLNTCQRFVYALSICERAWGLHCYYDVYFLIIFTGEF